GISKQEEYQQQNKRQNTKKAYTAGPGEKREYTGSFPLCTKCHYHNKGPCAPRYNKCKKIGHLACDCRSSGPNGNNKNRGNSGTTQNAGTCYECSDQGHFKRDCLKLKNRNYGNQGGNGNTLAKVYVVGSAGTNPDSNVVMVTFFLNNLYASILFDTGVDRSFVSTAFSSLIDITPTTLDHYYNVELADRKIIGINTIIWGCTLNFLDHPFNIDLMPVELVSFNVIVGMDWLAKYHAVIDCAKKIVHIPWVNETLIVHGDGSNQGNETRLNIISRTKIQKYMLKGHHVFLAHVTTKETKDKSGEKRLKDVPIVQEFPEVFPKDLPGLPPTRQVEFQIDLIPGDAPVARAPYRLAPSEMKELSEQLLAIGLSSLTSSGRRYSEDRFQELLWSLRVCKPYLDKFVIVFIDDILIYSKNKEEHEEHLRLILELLKKEELFIEGFYKIAKAMTKLTKKKVAFEWGDKQEAAFQTLKNKLCSAPILALPQGAENFIIYWDASHKGLGTVLIQNEKVIAYASRQLKNHEKKYTTHNLELGAVVFALKIWRHYLYGTKCTVFTYYKSLQHILDQKELNMRQRHWLEFLSDHDCEIRYHLGKANIVADAYTAKNSAIFLPMRETDPMEKLARMYLKEVAPFEALYGQKCRSPICWVEVGEVQLVGLKIVQETTEKVIQIKQRIQAARNRQKRYADLKRNPMEFQVGDRVMLKVSPWKGVVHFGKRAKLNPRYVGPFKVLAKVGAVVTFRIFRSYVIGAVIDVTLGKNDEHQEEQGEEVIVNEEAEENEESKKYEDKCLQKKKRKGKKVKFVENEMVKDEMEPPICKKDKDERVLMVVEKGKEVVLNEKVKRDPVNILTRMSPSHLKNVLDSLTTQQVSVLEELGLGEYHNNFNFTSTPGKLGLWIVNNYDHEEHTIKMVDGRKIKVTRELIHEILGVPMGEIKVNALLNTTSEDETTTDWRRSTEFTEERINISKLDNHVSPIFKHWSTKLLKKRQAEEEKNGDFGQLPILEGLELIEKPKKNLKKKKSKQNILEIGSMSREEELEQFKSKSVQDMNDCLRDNLSKIKALLLDTNDKIKIALDENPEDIDLKMIIEKRLAFFKELNHRDDDNAMVVLDNGNDVPEESVKDNDVSNEKDDVTEKQKDVENIFELDGKNTVQEINREKDAENVVDQDVDKPEDVEKESEFGNDENHNDSENKKNKGVLAINEDTLKDSQSETLIIDIQPKDSQHEAQDSQSGMEKGAKIQEDILETEEADFPSTGLEDIESLKGGRRNLFDEKSTVENVNEDDMILQDSLLNLPFLSTQEVSCLDIDTQKTPQIQKQGLQEESSQIKKHEIPKSFHSNKLKLAKYVFPDAQATGEKRQEVMVNETSMFRGRETKTFDSIKLKLVKKNDGIAECMKEKPIHELKGKSVDFKGGHPTVKRKQIKKAMEGEKNVPKTRGKKTDADKQDIKKPQVRKQTAAQMAKSKKTKAITVKPAPTKRK
ncbi:putative reverse transcriptase domain-containing protein, partial [Tanacetum coccineum]